MDYDSLKNRFKKSADLIVEILEICTWKSYVTETNQTLSIEFYIQRSANCLTGRA